MIALEARPAPAKPEPEGPCELIQLAAYAIKIIELHALPGEPEEGRHG